MRVTVTERLAIAAAAAALAGLAGGGATMVVGITSGWIALLVSQREAEEFFEGAVELVEIDHLDGILIDVRAQAAAA